MKMSLSLTTSAVLLAASMTAQAGAIYNYSIDNPRGSARAGDITNVNTSFNSESNQLSWSYSIKNRARAQNDAFWLVLNDGPNPKGIAGQLAILYGDLNTNTLQAFEYNGRNGNNSYANPSNLLASWNGAMDIQKDMAGSTTVSFDIDTSGINDADLGDNWEGIQFADKIGIWFHPSAKSKIAYDEKTGEMIQYRSRKRSWLDNKNRETTASSVPEPATLTLLGIGMAGMVASRRRMQK